MKKILTILTITMLGMMLSACTNDMSSDSYTETSAGQAQTVRYGVIVQALPVTMANQTSSGIGTLGGAALGAVLGSTLGGGGVSHAVGAIGGGLAGGVAGNAVGKSVGKQNGMQYIIRLDSGSSISIVQGASPALAVGQNVLILTGSDARDRVLANNTAQPQQSLKNKRVDNNRAKPNNPYNN